MSPGYTRRHLCIYKLFTYNKTLFLYDHLTLYRGTALHDDPDRGLSFFARLHNALGIYAYDLFTNDLIAFYFISCRLCLDHNTFLFAALDR